VLLADASAGSRSGAADSSSCGSVVVESRLKLPVAAGRWSALWMMPMPQPCPAGSTAAECGFLGSWPKSGEIDIVEQVNKDAEVLGTIHYATLAGGWHQWLGGKLSLSQTALLDWNIYQLVWNCTSLTWYVNSEQIYRVTKPMLGTSPWPFDEPFFLILNTAIGGLLTGSVAPDTAQSRPFMVDYVRVYAAPGPAHA
jgi:beta-glucanase (GH16 family)